MNITNIDDVLEQSPSFKEFQFFAVASSSPRHEASKVDVTAPVFLLSVNICSCSFEVAALIIRRHGPRLSSADFSRAFQRDLLIVKSVCL